MADLIKKIRTDKGDLQIDYTALANLPSINNNLLINSDFRNPVNQRGKTDYVGGSANTTTNTTYTIDRWAKRNYGSTVVVGDSYVRYKTENSNPTDSGSRTYSFVQSLENPEVFFGNTYTLSIKVKNVSGSYRMGIWQGAKTGFTSALVASAVSDKYPYKDIKQAGIHTLSFTINQSFSDGYSVLNVGLVQFSDMFSEGNYIDIEWIKLEQGTAATPFMPRLYAEELMLCRRYYRNDSVRLISYQHTSTYAYFGYNYEPMRAAPTFSYEGFAETSNHAGVTATSTAVQALEATAISRMAIRITFNDTSTAYYRYASGRIKLDAEIY